MCRKRHLLVRPPTSPLSLLLLFPEFLRLSPPLGVDLHNVFGKLYDWEELDTKMNSPEMRTMLHLPDNVTWNAQRRTVFQRLANDFLTPVTREVEFPLTETNMKVVVYTASFDVLMTMMGTEKWIDSLNCYGKGIPGCE